MGRKSRKDIPGREIIPQPVPLHQKQEKIPTGAYIRLSLQNNGLNEMDSITIQTQLVVSYIQAHEELELVETYVDNGYTGTKFDRPQFTRMMEDVKKGKIRCIVVKDLSRFGRDYLETGYYIDTLFPLLNVRFIAITDQFDSIRKEDRNNLVIPMKNMVNAMFAKDISRKQGAYHELRRKQGTVVPASAPLGYQYSNEEHRLVIDKDVEIYIRMTFAWHFAGVSDSEIAKRMSFLGAPTYSVLKQRGKNGRIVPNWSANTVRGILKNPTYAGFAVMGKSYKSLYQGIPTQINRREDWIMFPGVNEAYISAEDYYRIVERIDKNRNAKEKKMESTEAFRAQLPNCFQHKVICAICGKRMVFKRKANSQGDIDTAYSYYQCSSYKQRCAGKRPMIHQSILKVVVMANIRNLIRTACDRKKMLDQIERDVGSQFPVQKLTRKAGYLEARQTELEQRITKAYEDHTEGVLDLDDYRCIKERLTSEKQTIQNQIADIRTKMQCVSDAVQRFRQWAGQFENCMECDTYSQELVDSLVKEIRISDEDHIEIVFSCEDVYRNAVIETLFQEVENDF